MPAVLLPPAAHFAPPHRRRDEPARGCEVPAASEEEPDALPGRTVAGQFRLGRRIGSGSFGSVYAARHDGSGQEVAVKLEPSSAKYPQLSHEARVYEVLSDHGAVVPRIHWYGSDGDHQALVMDLLGPSLLDLHERCGGAFSLETSVALTEQIISRLEELHSAGLLHRDIKPDNFCMGQEASSTERAVYALDFGCAKRYRDPQSLRHIPEEQGKRMIGTARYASLRAHLGQQLSRRDDLESVGYLLVWFLKGRLPWQGLDAASTEERMAKIAAMKSSLAAAALCEGLPREIEGYVAYCRGLRFEEQPDYARLRSTLRAALGHESAGLPPRLDWQPLATPSEQQPPPAASSTADPAAEPAVSPVALRFDSPPRWTLQAQHRAPPPALTKADRPAGCQKAPHSEIARAPRPGRRDVRVLLLR